MMIDALEQAAQRKAALLEGHVRFIHFPADDHYHTCLLIEE